MGLITFSYRTLRGTGLYRYYLKTLVWLKKYYYASGLPYSFQAYIALLTLITILVCAILFPVFTILHIILFKLPTVIALLLSIPPTIASLLLTYGVLVYYPIVRARVQADKIDISMPYLIAYMTSIAAAGRNIEAILERVAAKGELFNVKREFNRIVSRIAILGQDSVSVLRREAENTTSTLLSTLLDSLAGLVESGGNVKEFLEEFMNHVMRGMENRLREVINSMMFLMEFFISLLVVFPLVFIIIVIVLSSLGGGLVFGIPPMDLIFLVLIIGLPIAAIALVLMISSTLSRIMG
ncbi:MAG TPA: hypothetical protein EYH40_06250 [Desulfurococcales archaeon]|nr:hypothetical protein [Desulfurococcales archaeon]